MVSKETNMTKIIKLTRGLETIVSDEDYDYLNQYKWYANNVGRNRYYATRWRKNGTLYMHKIIGERIGLIGKINHRDLNTLNNQRDNLRLFTHTQSMLNRRLAINNTSGYRGVSYLKSNKRWYANIGINGIRHYLGSFGTREEAALAYNEAAIRLYGEYATLNVISND